MAIYNLTGATLTNVFLSANSTVPTIFIGPLSANAGTSVHKLLGSVVEGNNNNVAAGLYSHAEGGSTTASGPYSHAEGVGNIASGYASHVEGQNTKASGTSSHAEGTGTLASGYASHAEGVGNIASGDYSHVEGNNNATGRKNNFLTYTAATKTFTFASTVSGNFAAVSPGTVLRGYEADSLDDSFTITVASRNLSNGNIIATEDTIGDDSTTGYLIDNNGICGHAEGANTTASGQYSHAEGYSTVASGQFSHAEGISTTARGTASHVEGQNTTASGTSSHAEGTGTLASGYSSHAEGVGNIASGDNSHVEGNYNATGRKNNFLTYTAATKTFTFANTVSSNFAYVTPGTVLGGYETDSLDDFFTITAASRSNITGAISATADVIGGNSTNGYLVDNNGFCGHAEGSVTEASGPYSHAEGYSTVASGEHSHAEGYNTTAAGLYSHAEGYNTTASGNNSHAEGYTTTAAGLFSHAEGNGSESLGYASHAEGRGNIASGYCSHAEGINNIASDYASHAEGADNIASGDGSHAEGTGNIASGNSSHAEGTGNIASGELSHVEGTDNITGRKNSFLTYTAATKIFTFASTVSANFAYVAPGMPLRGYEGTNLGGKFNIIVASRSNITGAISATADVIGGNSTNGYLIDNNGICGHAEGSLTEASGPYSHAEGYNTTASGNNSHAQGIGTKALSQSSHAEGGSTTAVGLASHAEGGSTVASGNYSHAEGASCFTGRKNNFLTYTAATKTFTFASSVSANFSYVSPGTKIIGEEEDALDDVFTITVASRNNSNGNIIATEDEIGFDSTDGYLIDNSGEASHAEGSGTIASGVASHAEGVGTAALGFNSHAEGIFTTARGTASHAAGSYAEAAYNRSWIWKGSTATNIISTTKTDQFMVSAAGGLFLNNAVGINTDSVSNALTVNGTVSATRVVADGTNSLMWGNPIRMSRHYRRSLPNNSAQVGGAVNTAVGDGGFGMNAGSGVTSYAKIGYNQAYCNIATRTGAGPDFGQGVGVYGLGLILVPATSGAAIRVIIGDDNSSTPPVYSFQNPLTTRGIGFELKNYNGVRGLKLFAHNGTTYVESASAAVISADLNSTAQFWVKCDTAGNAYLFYAQSAANTIVPELPETPTLTLAGAPTSNAGAKTSITFNAITDGTNNPGSVNATLLQLEDVVFTVGV